jgi:hypothetical protein
MSIEAELRQQLSYELSGIEGVTEIWLDALDTQDATVEGDALSPVQAAEINARVLHFCREATFRLAREIDELRSPRGSGDDLS